MKLGLKIANAVARLFYPSKCPLCSNAGKDVSIAPICRDCWGAIERLKGGVCRLCSKPGLHPDVTICGDCYADRPRVSSLLAYSIYDGALKEAIHLFKFSKIFRFSTPLGKLLCELPIPEADVIVPVPLTRKRLNHRGFNQSLLLADKISKHTGIKLSIDLLLKKKETDSQTLLNKDDRKKALRGAFHVAKNIKNTRVILVDDVVTTGTTINECAKTLLKAGATHVTAVVLARTVDLSYK
ncbi:ComF family protein [Candidatus Magnetomonas plexicatena]|uniref:ComF family protein n=1 Tax=Candidatus Magnetomonas plexicatena TaxID=2552947 RepID=UPI001C788981|nr:ComF family protein [Nitrospirales bacterium LBB_01]